jgi:hypothetical protein
MEMVSRGVGQTVVVCSRTGVVYRWSAGKLAYEQLVGDDTEGELVGPQCGRLVCEQLGGGIGGRAEHGVAGDDGGDFVDSGHKAGTEIYNFTCPSASSMMLSDLKSPMAAGGACRAYTHDDVRGNSEGWRRSVYIAFKKFFCWRSMWIGKS